MIFKYQGEYSVATVRSGLPLIAVLEDMAQVTGYLVPVIPLEEGETLEGLFQSLKEKAPDLYPNAILIPAEEEEDCYLAVEADTEEEGEKILDIIEKNSQAIYEGENIGGAQPLDEALAMEERRFYLETYSKREKENRLKEERPFPLAAEALVDLSESLMTLDYLKWTWGNLSLRFGNDNMLITPSGRPYVGLTGADIVRVNIETGEWEGDILPSTEKELHRLIYQAFPEARVIIHTHAPNSSVFAGARQPLELNREEGAKGTLFVGDFAPAGTKELAENIVKALKTPGAAKGALLANHGMICFGENITEAFDLCREIEEEAERILNV